MNRTLITGVCMIAGLSLSFAVGCAKEDPGGKVGNSDKSNSAIADQPATDANADKKAETSPEAMPKASVVLANAIAAAKAGDKALFVHFTADW